MRSIVRRLAQLALVPAALLGVVAVANPAQAAAPTVAQLQVDIFNATNVQRVKLGCAKLRNDAKLGYAARGHAAYQARTNKMSHTGSSNSTFAVRASRAGYVGALAENVAYGYRSGAQVVSAWMASPGHRANIANCRAKAVGVGAFYSANGTPYYTQDFGSR
ncbi:CAP domain-containing protein [Actinoplanes sp. NPDC049265]|uniref:CAP domain-containing protein n=1 Tax=Actinoplanes sp. NPDC049265 TaxID=3363902 RepID=UPI0037167A75